MIETARMIEIARTLVPLSSPILITGSVLRLLKNRPDRDLALPMPFMLLVVLRARVDAAQHDSIFAASVVALLVLLYGCWQQKRSLARWATVACAAAAFYIQLSAAWLATS